MSLIEGVGDEVTVVVTIFFLCCLVLLAWFSTLTRDIPFVSVIVVELSQRRNRARNEESAQGSAEAQEENSEEGTQPQVEAGSNNNADSVSSDEEQSTATAELKTDAPGLSSLPSDSSATVGLANADVAPGTDSNAATGPCETRESGGVLEDGTTEAAAVTIPEFKPDTESTNEVRRRRVAYFENARGDKSAEEELDASCVGAQVETVPPSAESLEEEACVSVSEASVKVLAGTSSTEAAVAEVAQHEGPVTSSSAACLAEKSPPVLAASSAGSSETGLKSSAPADSSSHTSVPADTGEVSAGHDEVRGDVTPDEARQEGPTNGAPSREQSADTGGQQIRVRLKYLNDTQRLVYTDPHETVGNFRRLHFSSELEDNKIVRFIFNGQDLRNDLSTLQAYNINDNSVVHCLITQNRQNEAGSNTHSHSMEDDGQIGAFLYPVFGLILGLVWYMRFTYKQYFNAMSTLSLAGVSFIYVLALFSSMRHRRQPHAHLD